MRGDLDAAVDPIIDTIPLLSFPVTMAFDPEAPREIPTGVNQDWRSLAAYDLGACSLFVPWTALEQVVEERLVAFLLADGRFGSEIRVLGTGGRVNVGPVLRRLTTYESDDEIRFNGVLRTNSAGGCAPLFLAFETTYAPTIRSRGGLTDRLCGGFLPGTSGVDFVLENRASQTEVRDFCVGEAQIETGGALALAAELPAQFSALLDTMTSLTRSEAGIGAPVSCGCDRECGPGTRNSELRGPRSLCRDGFCDVRVELDRTFIMPEGIEIVFAEDEMDPQVPIMGAVAARISALTGGGLTLSCDPARAPSVAAAADAARLGRIRAVVDPAEL